MASHSQTSLVDPQLQRKGFGLKEQIKEQLVQEYHSDIIYKIQAAGNQMTLGDITFHLASSFGFCYGVDRAVDLAYETRKRFPDKKIYLTAQIIHNPRVNNNLEKMGVRFVTNFDAIGTDDVVILPAFGASVNEVETLKKKGCVLVDTTCGSVLNVWKRVESYAADGFTSIIHGKVYHEETQATSSRVSTYPEGEYLIVLNREEAKIVCDYIREKGTKTEFLKKFSKAVSPGFDPDRDLAHIGVANQTTMLMSESLRIAEDIKEAMIDRYGTEEVATRFRNFDTICSATEDRQNAVVNMKNDKLDLMIVVGGFNSSNTTNLAKMASSFVTSYHIDGVDCVLSPHELRHKPPSQFEPVIAKDWLPNGPLQIGITSGASTPNQVLGEVVEKITSFRK
ncbi:MAG: 4-hydroxy-3-methylbut-2-enyl diphosphate reductase [bacterium]|nr:4-hydroxy-3-methylbut-2-enyl diphosphate reductase [bacterium]